MAANLLDLAALRQSLTRLRTQLNGKADSSALATKADKTTATTTADGLMSKEDKATLDSLANGSSSGGNSGNSGGTSGDGIYFTPHVASNGDLSWTNNGGLTNPTTVNIKGPTGPTGPTGPAGPAGQDGTNGRDGTDGQDGAPGQAATIEIGTVTAGSTPSVSNSGTATAAVLNFVLPQGSGSGGGGMTQEQVQAMINSALSANGLQEYVDVGGDNEMDAQFLRDLRTVIANKTGITVDVSDANIPYLAEDIRQALSTVQAQSNESVVAWNPTATIDGDKIKSLAIGQGSGSSIQLADDAFWKQAGGLKWDSLTTISLPNTLTIIGENAVRETGLVNLTVPASVTMVKDNAFADNKALVLAVLNGGIYQDGVFHGCDHLRTVTAASGVSFSGEDMFKDCSLLESVTVPTATTAIQKQFCRECNRLTSVSLHSGITSIGEAAFYRCLILPSFNFALLTSLTEIGEEAFLECERLVCTLSGCTSLQTIRDRAFKKCKAISAMTIPNSVTDIRDYAFEECSEMQSVDIGTGVLSIRDNAFKDCGQLASVIIRANSISLMQHPFRDCQGLTSLGPYNANNLNNYTIKVTWNSEIPDDSFSETNSLTSVTIPSGVTTIGEEAFRDCQNLASVTIPASVTVIEERAFSGCSSLRNLTFQGGTSGIRIETDAFDGVPASNAPSSNA